MQAPWLHCIGGWSVVGFLIFRDNRHSEISSLADFFQPQPLLEAIYVTFVEHCQQQHKNVAAHAIFKALWPYTYKLVNLLKTWSRENYLSNCQKYLLCCHSVQVLRLNRFNFNHPISSHFHVLRFHYWLSYNYNLFFILSFFHSQSFALAYIKANNVHFQSHIHVVGVHLCWQEMTLNKKNKDFSK